MGASATTALLLRARDGDRPALEELLARCAPRLLTLVRLRLGPSLRRRLESSDILQESLLKAYRGLGSFRGRDGRALLAWLARIAENEIRDRADFHGAGRRSAAAEVADSSVLDGLPDRSRSLTSRLLLSQRLSRLAEALEALDPAQREAIVGRHLEELTFGELGERMGRSPDACRMLLARGMARLTIAMGVAADETP
jgi:RNA polymerase sigma-70 factor (ECF subfamily)